MTSELLRNICNHNVHAKLPVNGSTAARDTSLPSNKVGSEISSTAASAIIIVVHCRPMVSMTYDLMIRSCTALNDALNEPRTTGRH